MIMARAISLPRPMDVNDHLNPFYLGLPTFSLADVGILCIPRPANYVDELIPRGDQACLKLKLLIKNLELLT